MSQKGEKPLTDQLVLREGIPDLWLGFDLQEAPSFEEFPHALLLVC